MVCITNCKGSCPTLKTDTRGVADPPFWCHTNEVFNQHRMNRPEVLVTASDYREDFKARWEIHQYEVEHLRQDIVNCFNSITDSVYYNTTGQS